MNDEDKDFDKYAKWAIGLIIFIVAVMAALLIPLIVALWNWAL